MSNEAEKLAEAAGRKAVEYLVETENCAYSPFRAVSEVLGLNVSEECLMMSVGFAGGVSGSGYMCGALWAAIAVLGGYLSKKSGDGSFFERNRLIHLKSAKVYRMFVEEFGSPNCRDLNPRFEWSSEEQRKKCSYIVKWAAETAVREALSD